MKAAAIIRNLLRKRHTERKLASRGPVYPTETWPRFYVRGNTFRTFDCACIIARKKAQDDRTHIVIWRQDSPLTLAYEAGRVIPKRQEATL